MKCVKISVQSHIKRTPDMNAPNPCLSTSYYCTSLSIRKTQQDMLIIVLLSLTFSFHSCFLSLYTSISHRFLNWACVRRTSSSPFSSFMILTVLAVFLKASKFWKKIMYFETFRIWRLDRLYFIFGSQHCYTSSIMSFVQTMWPSVYVLIWIIYEKASQQYVSSWPQCCPGPSKGGER